MDKLCRVGCYLPVGGHRVVSSLLARAASDWGLVWSSLEGWQVWRLVGQQAQMAV